jgi:hypothetical protein
MGLTVDDSMHDNSQGGENEQRSSAVAIRTRVEGGVINIG